MRLSPLAFAFVVILVLAFASTVVWLFTISPTLTAMMLAFIVSMVIASVFAPRKKQPNPFIELQGEKCPNCAQRIDDHDAVRAKNGIVWHERCARQMEAAGLWDGAK